VGNKQQEKVDFQLATAICLLTSEPSPHAPCLYFELSYPCPLPAAPCLLSFSMLHANKKDRLARPFLSDSLAGLQ
jgi:hypothetical protein